MQQQPIQQIHSSPSEGTSLQPESRAITRNKNELKNISEKRRRWEVLDIIFDSLSFFLSFYAVIFAFAYQFLNVSQFLLIIWQQIQQIFLFQIVRWLLKIIPFIWDLTSTQNNNSSAI